MDSAGAVIGPLMPWDSSRSVRRSAVIRFHVDSRHGSRRCAISLLVRERPHEPQPQARLRSSFGLAARPFNRISRSASASRAIGDFSNTLLILWATQAWTPRYGTAAGPRLAMLFYVGYNVVYTVSCYVSGLLADRFPKALGLATGYSLAVIPAAALLCAGRLNS